MSWYQSHCKALKKKKKKNTHTRSYQTSSHVSNFSQVGKAVCQPMRTLGTEEGDGSIGSWGRGLFVLTFYTITNLMFQRKTTAAQSVTNIPQPPISGPLNILRMMGGRRRWRDNSWPLHAIVGEVLHLDCLSDEQLGLPPLLVLNGLVDVHYLFTNVFVHFGQSLRNLCTVGSLLRHSVVETLWGRSECEQSDFIKLKKNSDHIFVWCLMNIF